MRSESSGLNIVNELMVPIVRISATLLLHNTRPDFLWTPISPRKLNLGNSRKPSSRVEGRAEGLSRVHCKNQNTEKREVKRMNKQF